MIQADKELREASRSADRAAKSLQSALKEHSGSGGWYKLRLKALGLKQAALAVEIQLMLEETEN